MQTIWTIQKILNWTEDYFRKHTVPDPRLSAELLLAHLLKVKRLDLYLQFERILVPAELEKYRSYIQRRVKSEPVQYITGEQEFMGLTFTVHPGVLIPRPETELLVEAVLQETQARPAEQINILDIGSGSGAIAISLAYHCKNCHVTGIEQSESAFQNSRKNAATLSTGNVEFVKTDALTIDPGTFRKFDIIVSNPPYISETDFEQLHPQVKNFEPEAALRAGKNGIEFIEQLIPLSCQLLSQEGMIFLEIGYDQATEVHRLLEQHQFTEIELIKDYQHINRIVKAKL
jgi:release factor glutamine methyltransferase